MLVTGVIVVEAILILMLLWVNLAGQPAALAMQYARIDAQSTQIAVLSSAVPTPTRRPCPMTVSHC